jgi:hypothetical protein
VVQGIDKKMILHSRSGTTYWANAVHDARGFTALQSMRWLDGAAAPGIGFTVG